MKFRDDIDLSNTWVASDTHFGHENIVGYCARPVDHDQIMLEQWRAHVPDDATVLHLGDLVWKDNSWFKHIIAKRLTGYRKLLILGNHDRGRPSFYRDCGFQIIKPFMLELYDAHDDKGLTTNRPENGGVHTVSFDHYPSSDPSEMYYGGQWRIHGHIHNNGYHDAREDGENRLVPFLANHINMSVEQTRYRPVNLKLLLDAAILGRTP